MAAAAVHRHQLLTRERSDPVLIIVVEDDHDSAQLARVVLEFERFEVMCAETGEAGLHLARAREPSLILLDIELPGMGGLDVLRSLRAGEPLSDVPVVMVTGVAEPGLMLQAMRIGADDFVTKPYNVVDLVDRVRAILAMDPAGRRRRREATLTQLAAELRSGTSPDASERP